MSRSETLYHLQELDTKIDSANKRIKEIDDILRDDKALKKAEKSFQIAQTAADEKSRVLRNSERQVADQNSRIESNQKKLYGGAITNPKELEDLQLEANSLNKYLLVLEDKQLAAMIESEEAIATQEQAAAALEILKTDREAEHQALLQEKSELSEVIMSTKKEKGDFLSSETLPDLEQYEALRKSSGGIAVTLMVSSSCLSCGANIPSAIEQQARSPSNLVFCPTCKRILHPG